MKNEQMDVIKWREQTSFLGYEFLSWLLCVLADKNQEKIAALLGNLLHKTSVKVHLGMRLVTCLFNHKEQKTAINCPILEESYEVFASLKNGHMVESLSLVVGIDEAKVSFVVHARDFAFTQMKFINDFENETSFDEGLDEEDQMREDMFLRVSALHNVERIMDALYDHFLNLRVDTAGHAQETAFMQNLIDQRLKAYFITYDHSRTSESSLYSHV